MIYPFKQIKYRFPSKMVCCHLAIEVQMEHLSGTFTVLP